jgi:hypothetical protein
METKIACPQHGVRYIRVHRHNGPGGVHYGEWHRCRRCDFQRWIRLNLFILAISSLTLGIYTANLVSYTKILS